MVEDRRSGDVAPLPRHIWRPQRPQRPRPEGRWASLVAASALALLALAAGAGLWVRPSADDWCILAHVNESGPVGLASHYYNAWSGRVSKGIPEGLVWHWRWGGAQLLPLVLIVSLTVSTSIILRAGLRRLGITVPYASIVALSATATALTLLAGTVPYQLTYWVAGSMTHIAPTAIASTSTALAILLTARVGRARTVAALIVLAVGGVVVGSWNEALAPVAIAYGLIPGLAALVLGRGRRVGRTLLLAGAWCGGVAIGFVVLYTSPGLSGRAQHRDQAAPWTPSGLSDLLSGWIHTWATIMGEPAYYSILALGVLAGLSTRVTDETAQTLARHRRLLLALPALLVVATSLVVIAALREGYGTNGWTYARTWAVFLFPAMLVLGYYGAALGYTIRNRLPVLARTPAVAVAVAVVAAAILLSLWPRTYSLAAEMRDRAAAWDANEASVNSQIAQGSQRPTFTPTPIAGSHEPFNPLTTRRSDWVARCVAQFLGVPRIVPPR